MVVVKEIEENGADVAAAESSSTASSYPKSKVDGAHQPSGKSGALGSSSGSHTPTNDEKAHHTTKVQDMPTADITSMEDSKTSTVEHSETKLEPKPTGTSSKVKGKSDISSKKMESSGKQKHGGISSIMKKFESSNQSIKSDAKSSIAGNKKSKSDSKPAVSHCKDKGISDKVHSDKKESESTSKELAECQSKEKIKSSVSGSQKQEFSSKQHPSLSQSKEKVKSEGRKTQSTLKKKPDVSIEKVKPDVSESHNKESGSKQQTSQNKTVEPVSEGHSTDFATKQQPIEAQSKGKAKSEGHNKASTKQQQSAGSRNKEKVKLDVSIHDKTSKSEARQQSDIPQCKDKDKCETSDSNKKPESANRKQPSISQSKEKVKSDIADSQIKESASCKQSDIPHSKGNVTDVSSIFKKEIKSVSMQEPDISFDKGKDKPDEYKKEIKSVSMQESDGSQMKGKFKPDVSDRVKKIKSVSMQELDQPTASAKSILPNDNLSGKHEKKVSDILSATTQQADKMEKQKDGITATKVGKNQKKKNKAKKVLKEKTNEGSETKTLNSSQLPPSSTDVTFGQISRQAESEYSDAIKTGDSIGDVSCHINETLGVNTDESKNDVSGTKDMNKRVTNNQSINVEVLEAAPSSVPEEQSSGGKKAEPVRPVYNSKHWIKNVKERLKMAGVHDEVLLEFSQCKSDAQRFACLYMQPAVHEVIHIEEWNKEKSEVEARVLRTSGNKFFQRKEFKESLEMYSESILKAPVESYGSELALAFANRSAVFYHLKMYVLCMQDIRFALKHGYPEHNQYKLYERKGKCCYHLKMKEEAISAFEQAIEFAEKAKLPEPKINKLVYDLEKELDQIEKIKGSCDEISSVTTFNNNHGPIPLIEGKRSDQIPCMSADVELKYTEEKGRGLFTKRDIQIGEVLIVEKPYCSVLLKGYELNHCHHCCNSLLAPLPCHQCSGVAFCSEECQQKAWETYHYAECKYLILIEKADIGMSHLALRMVLKAGFNYIKEYEKTRIDTVYPLQKGFNKDGIYDSSDYHTVFNLEGHSKDRSTTDLLQRTLTAIFLIKCLKRTSYFPPITAEEANSDFGVDEDENHALIGSHILRHIQMLPCNAHEVSELECNTADFELSEVYEFGSAIYPVLSLINHSCDPSVVRHSYGDLCVVRAIRNIYKNEELLDNYGALYAMTRRAQRQEKLLSQYYFKCVCLPCQNDWPLYTDVPQECPVLKCKKCHGPIFIPSDGKNERAICSECREVQDITHDLLHLSRSEELYQSALEKTLKAKDLDECLPILVKHLQLLDPLLCRPWRDYNNCQEAIKQCYSTMGNCIKGSK